MNSEKLKAHFEDNPRDLQLLQHDRPLSVRLTTMVVFVIGSRLLQKDKAPEHLKHIPFYMCAPSTTLLRQTD